MDEKVPRSNIIETEIPMGTVHPAALEPYRVRFFVEDEIVQEAEITIGVNHRGIERIMEGLPVEKANALTEKICGICSNFPSGRRSPRAGGSRSGWTRV